MYDRCRVWTKPTNLQSLLLCHHHLLSVLYRKQTGNVSQFHLNLGKRRIRTIASDAYNNSYVFLLERARIVRAPFVPRRKDMLWIVGMIFICGGFGVIAIVGYITPVVELSGLDGRCRIGLPSKVSLPLMSFDIGVNVLLTGMFLYLLKPMLAHHHLLSMRGLFGEKRCERLFGEKGGKLLKGWWSRLGGMGRPATGSIQYTDAQKKAMSRHIKVLLIKCLVGSSLVMMPTLGNMIQFYVMQGRELGWICLTLCTLDGKHSQTRQLNEQS